MAYIPMVYGAGVYGGKTEQERVHALQLETINELVAENNSLKEKVANLKKAFDTVLDCNNDLVTRNKVFATRMREIIKMAQGSLGVND